MYPIIRFSNRKSANLINFKPRIGSGSASVGERFIEANGRDIMLIGNNCGTCNFYFELIDGLEASILDRGSQIAEKLNTGLKEDWDEALDQFAPLLPNGQ